MNSERIKVKRTIQILLLLFVSFYLPAKEIPENEKCISFSSDSPFRLSPVADGIAIGVLSASTVTAILLPKVIDMPEYYEFTYNLDNVNSLDRKFARKYRKTLDHCGDATLALSYCVLPAIYGTEFLLGNYELNEGITLLAMYCETILATQTAKCLLKTAIKRKRPYMYFDGIPKKELDNYDFEFSLPSGHTTDTFMNAAFVSYTFCKYYPESSFRIPVVAGAYSIAFATAGLRMASGNHFFTDTLAGAGLGTIIGFSVPWIHTLFARVNNERVVFSVSPSSCIMTLKF